MDTTLSERDSLTVIASAAPSPAEVAVARRHLHRKASLIAVLVVGSYWLLVLVDTSVVLKILAAALLATSLVATATCVFHDGNHGSFSSSRVVNRLAGYTGDLMGASSWIWRFKHNNLHHGNTNVVGVDTDIDQAPFARLTPDQPWQPWHRYQHIYMWVLYGFLTLQWFLISDFADLRNHGVRGHPFPHQPRRRDTAGLAIGKLLHVGWAVALPLVFHRWWVVLVFYIAISWTVGLLLATMFQLAHCTELADFPRADSARRGEHFVEHQLRTTVDVRSRTRAGGRALHWMMGGLDYQVEHHLAPRLPHTVYPLTAARLERICAERGFEVRSFVSPWQAIRSHGRWLRMMGARPGASSLGRDWTRS